jgi:hypothetical protein
LFEKELLTEEVDFSVSNVHEQIQEMEKKIRSHDFENRLNLSSSHSYSNANYENAPSIPEYSEEDLYNLSEENGKTIRKISVLKNLVINLGKLYLLTFYLLV